MTALINLTTPRTNDKASLPDTHSNPQNSLKSGSLAFLSSCSKILDLEIVFWPFIGKLLQNITSKPKILMFIMLISHPIFMAIGVLSLPPIGDAFQRPLLVGLMLFIA